MKISIITATYNSSRFIEETYNSILNQSYTNWEWLVTDDASTDNTYEILVRISNNDPRVKIFRNRTNSGAAVSRNNSLDHVDGKYIAFIDADDTWCNSKLSRQIEYMKDNGFDFTFTAYNLIDENGHSLKKTVDSKNKGAFNYHDMLAKKATLGCSTVVINSKILNESRMPLIRTGQDYAFWLLLLKQGYVAHIFPELLTNYRINSNSISRNKLKKAKRQWQIYREFEGLNFFTSLFYFSFYAYRALFRKG
ncbi:glycosyltransferase family 2 protein [Vibrio vulnificus]|uniref:glycosyltransferase family 2 protein n=1 Tax=Vibrio vulnificus TaxID=672 RepID=UPI00071FA190|nr:glycosyltransferase family 2 protein [Vibrio vulnificus]ALM72121.1 Putative N-acetylgalactosaminyl-diphosphoundecaprenol glucuronosyltransferase [Vibrio vulnificus]ANH62076.1 hypothetical protein FORC16_0193 [Vibrio vulnificus]